MGASRLGGLDFLRAVAVLFVVFGHATDGRLGSFLELSGLGVKIFFVLSGFLITRILLDEYSARGRIDFLGFYRRRLARLMPVFYLFLAAGTVVLWWRDRPIPWAPIASSILYATNYYQAFTGAQSNLVSHCWSLAVEEQFYFLWPVLIVFLLRRRLNLAGALVLIVGTVWGWRWAVLAAPVVPIDYLYRALETRADDLATGCLLAVLVRSVFWRSWLAATVRVPGLGWGLVLGLLLMNTLGSSDATFKYGVASMLEPLMIALLVLMSVLVSSQPSWSASLLNNAAMVHIGKISYCIYLFHGLIGYSAARVATGVSGSALVGIAAEFLAVIGFASASFRWFESPMQRWIAGAVVRHGAGGSIGAVGLLVPSSGARV